MLSKFLKFSALRNLASIFLPYLFLIALANDIISMLSISPLASKSVDFSSISVLLMLSKNSLISLNLYAVWCVVISFVGIANLNVPPTIASSLSLKTSVVTFE